jgi:hypothetical protein
MAGYEFHGHAIVSDDDMIADADGNMPEALTNAADWKRFQHELDRAVAVVLGRHGHESHANVHKRNRVVLSSQARGIERRPDAWWWNPAQASLAEMLAKAAPKSGVVSVPGGRRVFDYFLDTGYDEFHLARARGIRVPGGVPVFSECATGRSAEDVLAARGLTPYPVDILDAWAGVSVTVWQKQKRR